MLRNIMRRAVRVLWILTVMLIIGVIPWMITQLSSDGYSVTSTGQMIAGIFTLGACMLSIWQMAMHIDNFMKPKLQTPILRILLMVPIYALNGWLSLMVKDTAIYLDCMRKIYEAFVLNQFFVYLTSYLGGDPHTNSFLEIERKLRRRDKMQQHIFPLCWLQTWSEETFVQGCRTGVNAYVFCRVVSGILELVLQPFGLYRPGDLSWSAPYLYFTIVNNIASCWAIYCLILFYIALEPELRPINPLSKFVCIKIVVFFSWWQSVILVLLEDAGLLTDAANAIKGQKDGMQLAVAIQDFFICIEMLFVALAHTWAFSYKEFRGPLQDIERDEDDTLFHRVVSMFDFRDIGQDVLHSTRHPVVPQVDRESVSSATASVRATLVTPLQPLLNVGGTPEFMPKDAAADLEDADPDPLGKDKDAVEKSEKDAAADLSKDDKAHEAQEGDALLNKSD